MPYDKKLHYLAGFGIAVVGSVISPAVGLYLSFVAGFMKEVYDLLDYGAFDKNDMLFTWAGGLTGYIIVEIIKWIF